ncbi:MAG: carbamoyltransferase HypF, partial [Acidimicrobiales bacterium]
RYTIVLRVPYDRASTTMARFTMCEACKREYDDPSDRRFHAQPNACPACGPELSFLSPTGSVLARREQALEQAVAVLRAGGIVAVKGLGGYHLAADATSDSAVVELRRRKSRDDKAFALMVRSLAEARRLVVLSPAAEEALISPRRPIVLAPRATPEARARSTGAVPDGSGVVDGVVDAVAPGLPELGVMLAYTPLHHLLVSGVGRPLVLTSGNLSDDPIAYLDADAVERLGPLVDGILSHDRQVHIRCDDSVERSTSRGIQSIRRSRGHSPEPLRLASRARRQVLAVGAELKSTVAVAKDYSLVLSHHIGDLEHLATYRSFVQAVEHLRHLYGITPDVVAHDLHPEYLSTKWALEQDVATFAVQHHHAHVASCLADHGHEGRVLGVAFDGLGYGTDGTLWGGEFLVADATSYERVAHLGLATLPGGARAIAEPWRMALSWVHAFAGHVAAEELAASWSEAEAGAVGEAGAGAGGEAGPSPASVVQLIESGRQPVTSSAGRLFDAVAALLGVRSRTTYEGQAAIELEALARGAGESLPCKRPPDYELAVLDAAVEGPGSSVGPLVLDPRPLIGAVLDDLRRKTSAATIALRFHHSLGVAVAELALRLCEEEQLSTAVLTGGVFQNTIFTDVVAGHIEDAGT